MHLTMRPEAGQETQVVTSTESFLETTRGTMNGRICQDQQGLADLRDGDPRRDPGNGRVEDGHGEDAERSKIGGTIGDRDWDTGSGKIEFDLLQDGEGEGDEESSIWIGDRRQKP